MTVDYNTFITKECHETHLSIPDWLEENSFYITRIWQGLELWVLDCTVLEEIIFQTKGCLPVIQFHYNISGQYEVQFEGQGITTEYEEEHLGIYFYGTTNTVWKITPGTLNQFVSIRIYQEFFNNCAQGISILSTLLGKISEVSIKNSSRCINNISPQLFGILQDIIEYRFVGLAEKQFLEDRVFHLLLYQFVKLSPLVASSKQDRNIPLQDRQMTQYARRYLEDNLQSPPSLAALAKRAGMSSGKLNNCFRQLYGMTVAQYLRHKRLFKAKEMLQRGDLSVTEVAFLVGYHSPSHFSKSYKNKFGKLPSS